MPTYHVMIKGKVQGVFFRATAKDVAVSAGVKGWVRNSSGGDVEAIISGTEDACRSFINWCETGPPLARVDEVIVTPNEESVFADFKIKRGEG